MPKFLKYGCITWEETDLSPWQMRRLSEVYFGIWLWPPVEVSGHWTKESLAQRRRLPGVSLFFC